VLFEVLDETTSRTSFWAAARTYLIGDGELPLVVLQLVPPGACHRSSKARLAHGTPRGTWAARYLLCEEPPPTVPGSNQASIPPDPCFA